MASNQDPGDEIVAALREVAGLRGTVLGPDEPEGEAVGTSARSSGGGGRRASAPSTDLVTLSSWLPDIVTLNSEDVDHFVTELLRIAGDVTEALGRDGLSATDPAMAFVRVDVAKRVTDLASVLLDRTRRMSAAATGEIPIVPAALVPTES